MKMIETDVLKRFYASSAAILAIGLISAGCGKKATGNSASPGQAGPPPTQVIAVAATLQPVSEKLSLVGTVAANESVEIKSEIDGVVAEIGFQEGQKVEKGHLLIRLDESKLAAAVAEAEANHKLARTVFERSQELYRNNLVSQQEYDQAFAAFQVNEASLELKRRQLKDARIHAPFQGVTGERRVSPGQVITKNTTLTWLVDADPVKVEFNVPERFLSQLQLNQTIEVGVAAYPGKTFKGRVYFVAPVVDAATRTALVKAEVPNPDYRLLPGMFANLDLTLELRENAVVIPEAALSQLLEEGRARLFVVGEGQTAQIKQVRTGVRMSGRVEILSGLDAGELVIVEGHQKIGPGSKVTLAPKEAAAPYLSPQGS